MQDDGKKTHAASKIADEPHAPVIYFDGTPACGHYHGVIGITLSVDLPRTIDGQDITVAHNVIAYLRTSLNGARALRESLDKAILLAAPATGATQ